MNFLFKSIVSEIRTRSFWIFICLSLTWFTCYWFSEDLFFLSAKSFLIVSHSGFICTRLTEALSTYVTISLISCFYFLFFFLSHQIWCFLIPSCYEEQRKKYNKFFCLSAFSFFLFSSIIFVGVVPNVWHFLYKLNKTSTNLLVIKLQPKIFDYIVLTVRILFISSICSQLQVLVICLLESRGIFVKSCIKNRRFFIVLSIFIAAFLTPPDIWCQIVACSLIYCIIELTIFYALIIQVYKKQLVL
uniref:Sec-independent protein translocase protein n=1 Tax=Buxbaumia aphylla TaxID=70128 RepID=A0A075BN58_BUXAP|nr:Sec-independent protein translocase protein [Buxbaumia aphylla]AGN74252.1 Sec-independent protein translocase protein [Buxbaumia aphylla]AHI16156.1 Sec-independent protein translocase protein [Buxbaumia aphylla]